ncbi:hypothetical protein NST50_12715 [Paenibacillus sp. FSL E2-0202]|uniref:hypothetical protein n=1 Tax=Paenibacillus TaxID=44249 RepID=UPI00158E7487|nr:hypothetical protein [Paenibacillus odorifer]
MSDRDNGAATGSGNFVSLKVVCTDIQKQATNAHKLEQCMETDYSNVFASV